ncbi:MAG: glycoside hydrolase family 25 protein [Bacilli bacterium]|nr:glycoside hydrolase family 25 protein [Bacilli bacterium]
MKKIKGILMICFITLIVLLSSKNVYALNNTLINIDYPKTNQAVTDTVRVLGWYMSETSNTTMKMYIDNQEITDIPRYARPDVINLIKGYGTINENPTPGYDKTINITNLEYGKHVLKIQVFDNQNKKIKEETRDFTRQTPKTLTNIDYPKTNQAVIDTVRVLGWYMSETSNTTMKMYIDNQEITDIPRYARPDVINLIKGYGTINENPTPGYDKTINITDLEYGKHVLKIQVFDNQNKKIKEETRDFTRQIPKTLINIDYPNSSQNIHDEVIVAGWYMSEASNTTIKMYIDNQETTDISRYARPDVINLIKGYGTINENPTPGYHKSVDIKSLKYGKHKIKIEVLDSNNNLIQTKEIEFKKTQPSCKINIDYPKDTIKQSLYGMGWYLTKYTATRMELYLDGELLDDFTTEEREDVLNAFPEYRSYLEGVPIGFREQHQVMDLKDGTHQFTVKVFNTNNDDLIAEKTRSFKIKKYDGEICIDFPVLSNVNSNFLLAGWEMSDSPNSSVKVYVDNKLYNGTIYRIEREDVLNLITGYGDVSLNPTPGFSLEIDISNLSEGLHDIRIETYSHMDEWIASSSKKINVFHNIYNGIDISSYNTVNSWGDVKNSGIEYVIARAAVRGYGINAQGIDGNLVVDSTFVSNINGARSVGLKCGAYVYTQAITELEAVIEANTALQQVAKVGGKSAITLPIVYDVEFSGCKGRCGRADNLDRETRTSIAIAFLETIKASGYQPMIYASTSFLNNQLNMSRLSNYPVWVAHYGVDVPTYRGPYQIWQYTSEGQVSGISGFVDLNYFYYKY